MPSYLDTKIDFLKGVGPKKAQLLQKDLGVFTLSDLISHYPFRYEDRSIFYKIKDLNEEQSFQIIGRIKNIRISGPPKKQRLNCTLLDETGSIDLVWFKGISHIKGKLKDGLPYIIYGKPSYFSGGYSISHPDFEVFTGNNKNEGHLVPIYGTTERLKRGYLDSKGIAKLIQTILINPAFELDETIAGYVRQELELVSLKDALKFIHAPKNQIELEKGLKRLKFEELFFIQLKIFIDKRKNLDRNKGIVMGKSKLLTEFYNNHLPFELTDAQKKVIKEIYADLSSGLQMNRLLQGDVGSGKTITAFVCMLIAIDAGFQTAIMAPTEILATQHYHGLKEHCDALGLNISLITGSTKKSQRKQYLENLISGDLNILVGTHALIENDVQFNKLGFVVIDEQHRFGVAQRAKLWQKNKYIYPHILVMTATPIPRTLAMTVYGDLEVSVIDQLPSGRKPIKTTHLTDSSRLKLFGFIQKEIDLGRQIYIVYPLIEESETLEYKDLMDGYESVSRYFQKTPISILHGKMKPQDKEFEMRRFVKGETKIMVATTVIEVGVNVPNASVMVIENSERFGLSQLHQLRGRVGRGAEQSYCILMTGSKLSKEGKRRVEVMVEHTDGFKISEKDLEIRGPGDLMGTQQSGDLDLKVADLVQDSALLQTARNIAKNIIEEDPELNTLNNQPMKKAILKSKNSHIDWGSIS